MSEEDSQEDATDDEYGRRRYLAAVGVASGLSLAGCIGGGDGNGDDTSQTTGGAGEPTATQMPTSANEAEDGTQTPDDDSRFDTSTETEERVCPTPPFSYQQYEVAYPMTESADPLVTIEAPADDGFSVGTANRQWSLEFGPRRNRLGVRPERRTGDLDEYAEGGAGSRSEFTDQYDVPDGARVVAPGNAGEVPVMMEVLLPTEADQEFVRIRVSLTNTENCPEATETVQDRIVDTVALV